MNDSAAAGITFRWRDFVDERIQPIRQQPTPTQRAVCSSGVWRIASVRLRAVCSPTCELCAHPPASCVLTTACEQYAIQLICESAPLSIIVQPGTALGYSVTVRHSSPLAQEAKSSRTAEWPSGTLLSVVVLSGDVAPTFKGPRFFRFLFFIKMMWFPSCCA